MSRSTSRRTSRSTPRRTWTTSAALGALALATVLSGCSAADTAKADRATELGCGEAPAAAVDAIAATLSAGSTLGEGSSGFERDGRWLVAAPLVDAEGITQDAGFAVDLASDPVAVTAESDVARASSSAPAGSTPGAADVLDCVFTVS
ncbi:hypothetical protein [Oerskovia turbata]